MYLYDDEPLSHEAQRAALGRPDGVTVTLPTAAAVRQYLDALNDNGLDDRAAGLDRFGTPFLVVLQGAYAETVEIYVTSPWDGERDVRGRGERCDDCSAANPALLADLAYPVRVLTRSVTGEQVTA